MCCFRLLFKHLLGKAIFWNVKWLHRYPGVVITAVLFAVSAFFTRAGERRILGALLGSLPLIPLVMFYGSLDTRNGYWHYPSVTPGNAPLAWYIAATLFYGAALVQLLMYWIAGPPRSDR
jgi:hypothetical protein